MEKLTLCLLSAVLISFVSALHAPAAMYRWVDGKGITHFTDKAESIPAKYRNQANELDSTEVMDDPAPASMQNQTTGPESSNRSSMESDLQDKGKGYWQMRYSALRLERKALETTIDSSKSKLNEARHKWVTSQKRADRQALNQIEADIAGNEEQLKVLDKKLEDLDNEATRQAVPFDWRK